MVLNCPLIGGSTKIGCQILEGLHPPPPDSCAPDNISPIYTGILIQIGCVYTEPGKLDSNPDPDHLSHMDCDLDSNLDSGPGARVNAPIQSQQPLLFICSWGTDPICNSQ